MPRGEAQAFLIGELTQNSYFTYKHCILSFLLFQTAGFGEVPRGEAQAFIIAEPPLPPPVPGVSRTISLSIDHVDADVS
jgi:hypothetical protein